MMLHGTNSLSSPLKAMTDTLKYCPAHIDAEILWSISRDSDGLEAYLNVPLFPFTTNLPDIGDHEIGYFASDVPIGFASGTSSRVLGLWESFDSKNDLCLSRLHGTWTKQRRQ